jgi:mono/diheme cytochrome c family protein
LTFNARPIELKRPGIEIRAGGWLMNKNWICALAGGLIAVAVPAASAPSQQTLDFGPGKPVPPGDVTMGGYMYQAVCWACHSADLSGYKGPPLTGPDFYKVWQGRSADALYGLIRGTMPKDDPGMSERAARDLVAYIVAYSNNPESLKSDSAGK